MNIFNVIASWLTNFWKWGAWKILALVLFTHWYFKKILTTYVQNLINEILSLVDTLMNFSLVTASTTFFTSEPVQLANYIFPLDTLLQGLAIIVLIYPVAIIIRVIKSFIPTVSG